jgi:hypothetical protein
MRTEISIAHPKDRGDYALKITLLGETQLEGIFLSHLQIGHTVELEESTNYGHHRLEMILHNKSPEKGKPVSRASAEGPRNRGKVRK